MSAATPAPTAQLSMDLDSIIAATKTKGKGASDSRRRRGVRKAGVAASAKPEAGRQRDRPVAKVPAGGFTTAGLQASAGGATKVSVTNLDVGVTEADLRELFRRVGQVTKVQLFYDKNGRSQGTAHIIYKTWSDAVSAISQYNGVTLDGRPMRIEVVMAPETLERQIAAPAAPSKKAPLSNAPGRTGAGDRGGRRRRGGRPTGGPRREKDKDSMELDADLDSYMAARASGNGANTDAMQMD